MNEVNKAEIRKRLGNIVQLRELLLGDQLEAYDSQLKQYHQRLDALEANWQKSELAIKAYITACIAQSEEKMLEQINLVAQDYSLKTLEEQQKLQQKLNSLAQYNRENIEQIHKSLNSNTNSIKTEIAEAKAQSKLDLDQNLALLKQELLTTLETNLLELTTNKISRTQLAEVLVELSLKLQKNTDSHLS